MLFPIFSKIFAIFPQRPEKSFSRRRFRRRKCPATLYFVSLKGLVDRRAGLKRGSAAPATEAWITWPARKMKKILRRGGEAAKIVVFSGKSHR